ncbi:sensor histidine kinase [Paraconexibacter sp.]|uniref:sensor histidine kinase n=1 Tax=Paraconexibacter sp. TaxID=2949640 RepID=UPI003562ECB8
MSGLGRSILFVAGLTGLTVTAAWLGYGGHAAWVSLALLGPLGVLAVVVGHVVASRRSAIGSLRRQVGLIAALIVAQLVIAVLLFVQMMFVSRHDAYFTVLVVAFAGAVGVWLARVLARDVMQDVDTIRTTLSAVGEGRRDVRTGLTATDELARLGAEVDTMIDRIDREESARRALMAAVSHDLRTPITALQLIAEGLEDDIFEPERRREQLGRMTTHVRALSGLIDDLFELTRLQAGDIRWTAERVALDELVQETVDAMRPQAEARMVAVRAELPPTAATARANPEQLQRVLFNLIQNAIRHTPADGSVVVRAEPVGDGVEIEVADTGTGIAEGERRQVFEAFFQGGERKARTDGGAGLGLAIARAIVEAHGGRIWLEDTDRGTRVRFLLPDVGTPA